MYWEPGIYRLTDPCSAEYIVEIFEDGYFTRLKAPVGLELNTRVLWKFGGTRNRWERVRRAVPDPHIETDF